MYLEYAGHSSELAQLITSERALARLNDSTFASVWELIKKVQVEFDRIENNVPPILNFSEKIKVRHASPARTPWLSVV